MFGSGEEYPRSIAPSWKGGIGQATGKLPGGMPQTTGIEAPTHSWYGVCHLFEHNIDNLAIYL